VTQRRVRNLHANLSALRRGDDDVHEFQWFTRFERHGCFTRDRFAFRGRHDAAIGRGSRESVECFFFCARRVRENGVCADGVCADGVVVWRRRQKK
jgi:hypothetical protein